MPPTNAGNPNPADYIEYINIVLLSQAALQVPPILTALSELALASVIILCFRFI